MEQQPIIQCFNVSKKYPQGFTGLANISFTVEKGEFVFLTGASGAGKTTLLKLLYMEDKPSSGSLVICGTDSSKIHDRDIPYLRRKLGIIFQDFRLLPDRSIFENVAFPLRVTGNNQHNLKHKVFDVLALTGLSHKPFHLPSQLSGGEQQRACFARAIANDPWILLADEPTGSLDSDISHEIFELLRTINSRGTTVVMATHDNTFISSYNYRTLTLSHGTLAEKQKEHI
jgi:cell division transport system ATP-binding protein